MPTTLRSAGASSLGGQGRIRDLEVAAAASTVQKGLYLLPALRTPISDIEVCLRYRAVAVMVWLTFTALAGAQDAKRVLERLGAESCMDAAEAAWRHLSVEASHVVDVLRCHSPSVKEPFPCAS